MNVEPSPAVESFKNWCLDRIKDSEDEIRKAQEYKKRGNIAIGDGMRELREDAGISKDELGKCFPDWLGNKAYYINGLESGKLEWTEEICEEYVREISKLYVEKNL